MLSITTAQGALPVCMVVKQCSIIAPALANSTCSSAVRFCDGNSACVTSTFGTFISRAAFTRAKISLRPRCPVANIMPCLAISSRQDRVASVSWPLWSSTVIRGGEMPIAEISRWISAQNGSF
jgi:hypothetical protein